MPAVSSRVPAVLGFLSPLTALGGLLVARLGVVRLRALGTGLALVSVKASDPPRRLPMRRASRASSASVSQPTIALIDDVAPTAALLPAAFALPSVCTRSVCVAVTPSAPAIDVAAPDPSRAVTSSSTLMTRATTGVIAVRRAALPPSRLRDELAEAERVDRQAGAAGQRCAVLDLGTHVAAVDDLQHEDGPDAGGVADARPCDVAVAASRSLLSAVIADAADESVTDAPAGTRASVVVAEDVDRDGSGDADAVGLAGARPRDRGDLVLEEPEQLVGGRGAAGSGHRRRR